MRISIVLGGALVAALAVGASARPHKRAVDKTLRKEDAIADSAGSGLAEVEAQIKDLEQPFADKVGELKQKETEQKQKETELGEQFATQIKQDEPQYEAQCCKPTCEASQDPKTSALTEQEAADCNAWSEREFKPFFAAVQQLQDDEKQREQDMSDLAAKWKEVESSDDYQALVARRTELKQKAQQAIDKITALCGDLRRKSPFEGQICFDNANRALPLPAPDEIPEGWFPTGE